MCRRRGLLYNLGAKLSRGPTKTESMLAAMLVLTESTEFTRN